MTVTVYTNYLVMTYDVIFHGTKVDLAKALDEGSVLLSIKGGGEVLINSVNAAIIEIKDSPLT